MFPSGDPSLLAGGATVFDGATLAGVGPVRRSTNPGGTREKIRAAMLIRGLQDHVCSKVQMSPTQVGAAEILLRKMLPDLLAAEHTSEEVRAFVVEAPQVMSQADWLKYRGQPQLLARSAGSWVKTARDREQN
jgi:hypothetical protein